MGKTGEHAITVGQTYFELLKSVVYENSYFLEFSYINSPSFWLEETKVEFFGHKHYITGLKHQTGVNIWENTSWM